MNELKIPVVATSGNLSDEPICTGNEEALRRLGKIADLFLVHDRPIRRHVDDSIVRVMMGREMVLRRARGYAPLPVEILDMRGADDSMKPPEEPGRGSILAVGAHLKNTVAVSSGENIFISQHIGDLETGEAYGAFENVIESLTGLYGVKPATIAADMHPAYLSTGYASRRSGTKIHVQHHYAHVLSCMAENRIRGELLGVAWDGTGFGTDATIWGGEFLDVNDYSFERIATFMQFRLPGGDRAIREPRRTALGVLYEIRGDDFLSDPDNAALGSFNENELGIIRTMLKKGINSPLTSSAGRLFDAAASLADVRQFVNYEGQAAMELEFLSQRQMTDEEYPFTVISVKKPILIDWTGLFTDLLQDVKNKIPKAIIAGKFHNTLSSIIFDIAGRIARNKIVLTGGCFQNRYLTERTVKGLLERGFTPYWHQRVPPNDGGIALGQIEAARRAISAGKIVNEPGNI